MPVFEEDKVHDEAFNTWNYRVLKDDVGEYCFYKIIEVFYDKNGNIVGWADVSEDCLIKGT